MMQYFNETWQYSVHAILWVAGLCLPWVLLGLAIAVVITVGLIVFDIAQWSAQRLSKTRSQQ